MINFRKIIILTIILAIFSASFFNVVFINKAKAGLTTGQAVGKAVGAGAACFLSSKIESFVAGTISRYMPDTIGEGHTKKIKDPISVPVVVGIGGSAEIGKSVETSDALTKSKDCIRDVMAKIIIDWIVDETIQWIQCNGTKGAECGKPAFVGNWGKFSEDAINVGIGEAINLTMLAPICQPFKLQVRLSLLPVERYTQRITCTLDKIVKNINDFYDDFRKGGWLAYNEAWQPQNNYFGLMLMYQDEALERAMQTAEAARNEALAGKGFLSIKKCVSKDADRKAFIDECLKMMEKKQSEGEFTNDDPVEYCNVKADRAKISCSKEQIVTPGDTVGQAAASAITSDVVWAANVKSWTSSLINAIINSITKRLIDEGLSYLQPEPPAPPNYIDPYAGIDPNLGNKRTYVKQKISDYKKFLNDLNDIIALKNQSLNSANRQLSLLNDLRAYNCQLPVPGGAVGVTEPVSSSTISGLQTTIANLASEISSFQKVADEISANVEEAGNISDKYMNSEVLAMEDKYNAFFLNNQSLINDIFSGTLKSSAEKEAADNQVKTSNIETEWNTCVLPKLPLNATSTQP